ncbi:MAG TPA: prolipoprotein diacylglyceryl transferase family protein [Acidimicrobiia bacterium]
MLASISYPPIPIFQIGPLRVSLHGLMAGVGFVVGAILMIREARRRGFDEVKLTSILTWGLVGSILGARYFTVPAHLDEGIVEALKPFGTFSIMGGFAGGIIAGGWRMRMLGVSVITHMDMASFGLAIGTVVGRIGDLFIVEHLGAKTDFFLGYLLKPGYDVAPQHDALEGLCNAGLTCGPYHHAALYDLLGAGVLLGLLYFVARRSKRLRYGALIFTWSAWYGMQRFLIDFVRNTDLPGADATLGPFTWNQWTGLVVSLASLAILAWITLGRKTPVVSPEQDVAFGAVSRGT